MTNKKKKKSFPDVSCNFTFTRSSGVEIDLWARINKHGDSEMVVTLALGDSRCFSDLASHSMPLEVVRGLELDSFEEGSVFNQLNKNELSKVIALLKTIAG